MSELENQILGQLSRIDEEEYDAFQESIEDEGHSDKDNDISEEDYSKYMVD